MSDDIAEMRRIIAGRPLVLATRLMPHHARLPAAPFHDTLEEWHQRMGEEPLPGRRGLRFAIAAPRGSAKSTVLALVLLLHDILHGRERYILLVSATQRQARQRLRAARRELEDGAQLRRVYKAEVAGLEATAGVLLANDTRVEALGAGQELRGVSFGAWRPTKIILDDAESSASVASPRRRALLHDWFREVVEHLGAPSTHLVAIGTILHREGLLATLLARPDFEGLRLRAIEAFPPPSPLWEQWRALLTAPGGGGRERARAHFLAHRAAMETGAEVLWPEHEDIEDLQAQLVLQGRRAFSQEKQNEPLGAGDALFAPEGAWTARRVAAGWERRPPCASPPASASVVEHRALRLFGYLDAALGRRATAGDYAALATVGLAPDGGLLLLELWVERAPPTRQVEALLDAHERAPFERLGLEATGFQELLMLPIEEESRRREQATGAPARLPLVPVRPRRPKPSRIAALEPLLSAGRLALAESLPEEFWRELADYPRVAHDDALDAAAGAVELALEALAAGAAPPAARVARRASGGGARGY